MIDIHIAIKEIEDLEIISKDGLFHIDKREKYNCGNSPRSIPSFLLDGGIYVLYKEGEVIKVGQSKNIAHRLLSHDGNSYDTARLRTTDWDSFSFIFCEDLYTKFITEAVYNLKYKPKWNKICSAI